MELSVKKPSLPPTPQRSKSDPNDWWYSRPTTKHEHSHRISFWNIEGIPVKPWHSKTRELNADGMKKYKLDTMLMAEINTFWSWVPVEHQWHKRNAGQLRNNKKTTLSYNRRDTQVRGQQQFGGVAVTSIRACIHRDLTTGKDPSGLARWSWHRYQGKGGISL
jgi:hypothetical protein